MCETIPEERQKSELRAILFQTEQLQHNRVYYFLVAETIFFLAASTAFKDRTWLTILAVAGIFIAILFTIINFKNYFRILWLSSRLEEIDCLYADYLHFYRFSKLVPKIGWYNRIIYWLLIKESTTPATPMANLGKDRVFDHPPRWHHTGNLFTWGLFIIVTCAWTALLLFPLEIPPPKPFTQVENTDKSVEIYYSRQYKADATPIPK